MEFFFVGLGILAVATWFAFGSFWPFVVLMLIALAVVHAMARANSDAAEKLRKSKDVPFDAMVARVTATGWHFALERDRYRIWHANDFAGIKREFVADTDYLAMYLHAIGCLGRDETFAGCRPRYTPVDAHDDFEKPADRLASMLYTIHRSGALTDFDIRRVVIAVLVREAVDHPAFHALRPLARAFVSGRAVSEAEVAGLIAAFDMDALTAGTRWHYAATADTRE
jgi:hypothetical protein